MKNIRQKTVDMRSLRLSPEEGFVLSRVDGATSVKDLVALTGLDESRIVDIIGKLSAEGAVEVDGGLPSSQNVAVAPVAMQAEPVSEVIAVDQDAAERGAQRRDDEEDRDVAAEAESSPVVDADPSDPELAREDAEQEARTEREYRKIYESIYHPLERDARVKAASEASGAHLLALCLDPDPQVIFAIMSNHRVTLECPRLVATHHRTHVGLEHVAKRTDFLADALVQRRLLRNPQLPGTILNRMVNPKLMMEVYKIAIDREIPERSRVMTREILRKKFMLSSSDERAALLFKTEGRCLILLVNCSLDAHATQILCSKNTYTILFIQNLARWSATPPQLLAHLLKMQVVRRNPGLRKMLLKHPNCPSEIKRSFQP